MSQVSLDPLPKLLAEIGPGKIPNGTIPALISELGKIWNELPGATEESMEARKLERGFDWTWHPPVLSFLIERHGGTVLGSGRGPIQKWSLDLDTGTATWHPAGYRQLSPMNPRFDHKAAAQRIADALTAGPNSSPGLEGVRWKGPDTVTITLNKFFPTDVPQQTATGRSKKLRASLVELVQSEWQVERDRPLTLKRKNSAPIETTKT